MLGETEDCLRHLSGHEDGKAEHWGGAGASGSAGESQGGLRTKGPEPVLKSCTSLTDHKAEHQNICISKINTVKERKDTSFCITQIILGTTQ